MTKFRKKGGKIKGVFVLILLLFLIGTYILFFSPLFKIRAIEILGNREIKAEEIRNNFSYKNIFLFTKERIKKDLIVKFPKISKLEIEKDFLKRKIDLKIEERKRRAIICQATETEKAGEEESIGKCFYIDNQGVIFENAPKTSGSLILLIKDYSGENFSLRQDVFKKDFMNYILEIKNDLVLETNIKILDFRVFSHPVKDLEVMTREGWVIIFDLHRNIKNQILSLKAALNEEINKEEIENLEYIDLRIENRIYYK